MHAFTALAALATCVAAAPRPAENGPSIAVTGWTVRADWSRCANPAASEVVLAGVIGAPGTSAGTGITDFQVPLLNPGYSLDLIIKPVGSLGLGAPYQPARVEVTVLQQVDAEGNFGYATYHPSAVGTAPTELLAQVAWFTASTQVFPEAPASEIEPTALNSLNVSASAATTVSPSFLTVYYCATPAV